MLTENFNEDVIELVQQTVTAYTIRRSISSPRLFSVIAVNKDSEGLYVVESDIDFDKAQLMAEEFNSKVNS